MLDEYVWGHVERISQEAPVPILNIIEREFRLGGSGNVINNIKSLGGNVLAAGVVGDDWVGQKIVEELNNMNVKADGVIVEKTRNSTIKSRLMSQNRNQQIYRIDNESVKPIEKVTEEKIFSYAKENINKIQTVIISDYLKGVVSQTLVQSIINLADKFKIPVIIDPKGCEMDKYKGATAITPNFNEAALLAGAELNSEESLTKMGVLLLDKLKLKSVLLTIGEKGMILFTKEEIIKIPAQIVHQVYDVTGAGDTVISVFGLAIASETSFESAAYLANSAAGIAVSKIGTATVTQNELINLYNTDGSHKIMSVNRLKIIINEIKKNNQVIVFTNGCFDLLHVGHVQYLKRAAKLGGILIVGLNSDDSVRRLKGQERPIVPQHERAMILAALEAVDYIVIFEEDTPHKIIKVLKPDILVKGKDYSIDQVVGKETVESYGGKVELVDLVNGKSTKNMINKIKKFENAQF